MKFDLFDMPPVVHEADESKKKIVKRDPPLPRTNLNLKDVPTSYPNYIEYIRKENNNTPWPERKDGTTKKLCLNLVLFGKVNSGKSSTGDMILGKSEFVMFKTKTSNILQTRQRQGQTLKMVEIPGIRTDELSKEGYRLEILKSIHTVTELFECEPDVYLYVISANTDFKDEVKITDFLYRRLKGIKSKTAIVFTHFDELTKKNISRFEFLENLPDKFKAFMRDYGCEEKVLFFNNNRVFSDDQSKHQVSKLFKILE